LAKGKRSAGSKLGRSLRSFGRFHPNFFEKEFKKLFEAMKVLERDRDSIPMKT